MGEATRQVEIKKLLDFINKGVYDEGFDYDVSVENVLENQLPKMFNQALQSERDRLVEEIKSKRKKVGSERETSGRTIGQVSGYNEAVDEIVSLLSN